MFNIEYLFLKIYELFTGEVIAPETWIVIWGWIKGISAVLSLLFLTGIIYAAIRMKQLREEDRYRLQEYAQQYDALSARVGLPAKGENREWQHVLTLVDSAEPGNWRLAVIEADVLLDRALTQAGYFGETIGDKLKSVDHGVLQTLNAAWEAHKVRNALAHEGSTFLLTQREARRVIDLYRQVLEEVDYLS